MKKEELAIWALLISFMVYRCIVTEDPFFGAVAAMMIYFVIRIDVLLSRIKEKAKKEVDIKKYVRNEEQFSDRY